ncbi:nucleotide sugar dehydrogenase [Micromonospora rifamycinica]|uniref:nucleotide sugar dehydrogenase n=1 Tax=Micromonospora rifamycinica TaxID=291594 RepID=UPI0033E4D8F4
MIDTGQLVEGRTVDTSRFVTDVAIIGGCGRVGLPLGLAFAARGRSVVLCDVNGVAVDLVNSGRMPFAEPGADELLAAVLASGALRATVDPSCVSESEHLVVVVGTPVDEHLSPDVTAVSTALERYAPFLRPGHFVALRSTVYPGVTAMAERLIAGLGLPDVDVAFCPERIAEGRALEELFDLPQIVGGRTPRAFARAATLFRSLTPEIVPLTPEEAELAKLFTNSWRYIKFAAANQFWMIANDSGLDFERVRQAIRHDYPRAADMPGPGFAAGPCLFKDTMQLAAFNGNNFPLGHSAMLVNEGLPNYVVARLEERFDLSTMRVGILGMAFKGGSDDPRESLAYRLRKILLLKAAAVLCADPFVDDRRLVPHERVLADAELLVIAAPHEQYRDLPAATPVIDIWGLTGRGVLI